jgi:hypothetical protein
MNRESESHVRFSLDKVLDAERQDTANSTLASRCAQMPSNQGDKWPNDVDVAVESPPADGGDLQAQLRA